MSKQKREEKDKLVIKNSFNKKNNFYIRCEVHREKLSVFCSSCSKCICHQCALFNGSVSYLKSNIFLNILSLIS
jgi:hypothetical protein